MNSSPDLYLLAGPNGAGKTTFYEHVLAATGLDFINADRIAGLRWPGDELARAYDAAAEAEAVRERYLADRRSFITESVFSHPSKVDLVTRAVDVGYRVHLRVLIVPVNLSVARVGQRVVEGGHDVPEAKIRQRHERLWNHVVDAMDTAYETRVYDSSGQSGQDFVEVARYQYGTVLGDTRWPEWAPSDLTEAASAGAVPVWDAEVLRRIDTPVVTSDIAVAETQLGGDAAWHRMRSTAASVEEAVRLLDVSSSAVRRVIGDRPRGGVELLGLKDSRGRWRVFSYQLPGPDGSGGEPATRTGRRVQRSLPARMHPVAAAAWWDAPNAALYLDGFEFSPRRWVALGLDPDQVVAAAEHEDTT